MSHHQVTSFKGSRRIKRKPYHIALKTLEQGLLRTAKLALEALDINAVLLFMEITNCRLCSQFLVMTARNSCCEPCLMDWMNEDDPDDKIIKCLKCNTPIKAAAHMLSGMGLKHLYQLVEPNVKKIKKNGHFVYPVVGKVQMYQLFLGFDRNNEDLADERIQKP